MIEVLNVFDKYGLGGLIIAALFVYVWILNNQMYRLFTDVTKQHREEIKDFKIQLTRFEECLTDLTKAIEKANNRKRQGD